MAVQSTVRVAGVAILEKDIVIMRTRLLVSVLASIVTFSSGAVAQDTRDPSGGDNGGIVGPLPPARSSIACYKLVDEPSFCAVPETPHVVNLTSPFNVIDLNGAWVGPSGERPYIYVYNEPGAAAGYMITVDLSLENRPDGSGYFPSGSTLSIVFPDDRDYTGTIDANGLTIRWSNNTVWNKL
jgi:hypothetical protein